MNSPDFKQIVIAAFARFLSSSPDQYSVDTILADEDINGTDWCDFRNDLQPNVQGHGVMLVDTFWYRLGGYSGDPPGDQMVSAELTLGNIAEAIEKLHAS